MLKIEHLSKTYGDKKAVDDLNLHIAPGEIYGFIGHNGAGKTTTLKSVAGILRFDTGEIYIDGRSIRTQPLECKRSFAYIPDNPDLYDYMTGIKYLNFIADIFHISAADRQMRIRKCQKEQGSFQSFNGIAFSSVRFPGFWTFGRHLYLPRRKAMPTTARSGHGLAIFCADGTDLRAVGCLRQRVQHLCRGLSAQGQ